jgi:hypothetical protein
VRSTSSLSLDEEILTLYRPVYSKLLASTKGCQRGYSIA